MSLLNKQKKLNHVHYRIFGISWAGWVFDFYDLILFTFLILPIGYELHLSTLQEVHNFFTPIILAVIATYYGLGSGIFIGSLFALSVAIFIWNIPETKGIELESLEQ